MEKIVGSALELSAFFSHWISTDFEIWGKISVFAIQIKEKEKKMKCLSHCDQANPLDTVVVLYYTQHIKWHD